MKYAVVLSSDETDISWEVEALDPYEAIERASAMALEVAREEQLFGLLEQTVWAGTEQWSATVEHTG